MTNLIKKGILVNFLGDTLHRLIFHQLCKNSANLMPGTWFYSKSKFSLEIIKRLLWQGRYFIKVTARPSFTRLRVIRQINRQINRVHYTWKEKICYEDSFVSRSLLKPPCLIFCLCKTKELRNNISSWVYLLALFKGESTIKFLKGYIINGHNKKP